LTSWASKAVHCGAAGAGQAAKICNNMILGVTMIATCEAFALADKLGLDRQKMFDVVSTSSGYSWTMNAYCPAPGVGPKSPADNGYKPGFAAELMLKDLRLSQQAANRPMPIPRWGSWPPRFMNSSSNAEDGRGMDFSAMLPRFESAGAADGLGRRGDARALMPRAAPGWMPCRPRTSRVARGCLRRATLPRALPWCWQAGSRCT
jgi:3-hydroxyisobutyrate dehydrogenase